MSAPGPVRKAWLRWKSLRLPWRKRFLVGLDLQGNTFWEFKDQLSSKQGRMRRIVQYPNTIHYSEVSGKISPAWHQWLRHTRSDPPSLTEQSQDVVRQKNLKILAAQADARWAAKPSYLDAPGQAQGQPLPAIGVKDPGGYATGEMATQSIQKQSGMDIQRGETVSTVAGSKVADAAEEGEVRQTDQGIEMQTPDHKRHHFGKEGPRRDDEERAAASMAKSKKKDNPWKKAANGPSEGWQPEAWNPGATAPRR